MSHMTTIGVRELRRDASRWLARVRGGESFVITDRGRPVASLGPLPADTGYEAMLAAGCIAAGSGEDLATITDRLDAEFGIERGEPLSRIVDELRADER